MDPNFVKHAEERMKKAVETIRHEVASIRTSKATTSLLDSIRVEYYGNPVPLQQVASVSAPEARLLVVQPWERNILPEVVKAIQKSDLGLTPSNDGKLIRLVMPTLTEERRKQLAKAVGKFAEDARVAIRNIRRDANDRLKALAKSKKVSQDEERRAHDQIQKATDRFIAKVDELAKKKEQEILAI